MRFVIDNKNKDQDKTISAEATLVTLMNIYDFINLMMARSIKDSFENKKPLKHLEIEVTMKADGKEVDTDWLLEQYPEILGLSEKNLAEIILKRAGVIDDR